MDKKNLAFDRRNFILLSAGMLIVIVGFILMSGGQSDNTHFDPSVFSTMRIKVAPVVCFVGYVFMIYGVVCRPKDDADTKSAGLKEDTSAEQVENNAVEEKDTIINTKNA